MMAVIMAAGLSRPEAGFPPNSKPKCLYHFQGEVILSRQIRLLKKFICMIRHLPNVSEEIKEYIRTIGGKVEGVMIIYSPVDERDQSAVFNRREKL